jgi:hypothetical protein
VEEAALIWTIKQHFIKKFIKIKNLHDKKNSDKLLLKCDQDESSYVMSKYQDVHVTNP